MNPDTEHLESKIAYLERANHELSDVVYALQRELADLKAHLLRVLERYEASQQSPTAYTAEQERPPHY